MVDKSKRRISFILFSFAVWILLTLNFKGNIWNSAWDFYHTFQYDSESLVAGRLKDKGGMQKYV